MTTSMAVALGPGRDHEELKVVTPLGIQFRDHGTLRFVTDGLFVAALSTTRPRSFHPAVRSPSGVFGFHGLPALRPIEFPSGDTSIEEEDLLIMVRDFPDYYLPEVFRVTVSKEGVTTSASPPAVSSNGRVITAYLFPAPTRPTPTGIAAVRADLWDIDNQRAAAHAIMKVTIEGAKFFGISDQNGQVLVTFPLPLHERLTLGSPPGSVPNGSLPQTWPITVQVFHQRTPLDPALKDVSLPDPWDGRPSLKTIFSQHELQQISLIHPDDGSAGELSWQGDFTSGAELVLKTHRKNRLWISAGSSPP